METEPGRRIEALGLWNGPIEVEPLPGGITNRNYLVRASSGRFVARLSVERPSLGIDRRNETACQRVASRLGIAPEVIHQEDGLLLSAWVPGRPLSPDDLRDPDMIARVGSLLRSLHDGRDELTADVLDFSAFEVVLDYADSAMRLNARLPVDLDSLLDSVVELGWRVGPFVPALCHNDLLASNVLADDRRVWLVDWEYAGVGNPLFDLAGFSANNALPASLDRVLLTAYRGLFDSTDLRQVRVLKAMSLLREALWAVIQTVASDIAFDYESYAEDNFRKYRQAITALRA